VNSFIKLQTNRRHYITQVDRHLTHNVLKAPSELGMIIRYIQLCDKKNQYIYKSLSTAIVKCASYLYSYRTVMC